MGSDQSNESLNPNNPTNSSSTQMLLHASSHSIISTHAQIATPTNIYETKLTASYENDDEASAGYDNDGSTQAEEND